MVVSKEVVAVGDPLVDLSVTLDQEMLRDIRKETGDDEFELGGRQAVSPEVSPSSLLHHHPRAEPPTTAFDPCAP